MAVQFVLFGVVYPCLAGLDSTRQPLYLNLCALGLLVFTAKLLTQRLAENKTPRTTAGGDTFGGLGRGNVKLGTRSDKAPRTNIQAPEKFQTPTVIGKTLLDRHNGWVMVCPMSHQLQAKGVSDEIKDSLRSKTLQKKIDEGLAGTARPSRLTRLRAIAAKARAAVKRKPEFTPITSDPRHQSRRGKMVLP